MCVYVCVCTYVLTRVVSVDIPIETTKLREGPEVETQMVLRRLVRHIPEGRSYIVEAPGNLRMSRVGGEDEGLSSASSPLQAWWAAAVCEGLQPHSNQEKEKVSAWLSLALCWGGMGEHCGAGRERSRTTKPPGLPLAFLSPNL